MVTKTKYLFLLILAGALAVAFAFPVSSPALAMHDHEHVHVLIDIKPGSYPNSINIRSQGKVPVALFGSPEFDVTNVDVASVMFGPMHQHDVGAEVKNFAFEDVNGDGYMDIIFKFSIQATGLTTSDTEACLHGMTTDEIHFCGHDSVNIIG